MVALRWMLSRGAFRCKERPSLCCERIEIPTRVSVSACLCVVLPVMHLGKKFQHVVLTSPMTSRNQRPPEHFEGVGVAIVRTKPASWNLYWPVGIFISRAAGHVVLDQLHGPTGQFLSNQPLGLPRRCDRSTSRPSYPQNMWITRPPSSVPQSNPLRNSASDSLAPTSIRPPMTRCAPRISVSTASPGRGVP